MQPSSAPFTYPPFPKGTKVVAVTLRGGNGRKRDGFNSMLSVISLLFLVLLSEGGRELKALKQLPGTGV